MMNFQKIFFQKLDLIRKRDRRSNLIVGLSTIVLIGFLLLVFLINSTNNRDIYESKFKTLFLINIAVASTLFAIISGLAYHLIRSYKRKRFGSQLLMKIACVFALAGVVPGVLIYYVSYQFVNRSIESWFDIKVESALTSGLALGRVTLDNLTKEVLRKSRIAGNLLGDESDINSGLKLERLRDQLGVTEMILWDSRIQLLASAGQSRYLLLPERPSPSNLKRLQNETLISWIEGIEDAKTEEIPRIVTFGLVRSGITQEFKEPRYLVVKQILSKDLVEHVLAVIQANREYQALYLSRAGLKKMYIGTLTLSLFLAIFGALLLAVILGNSIAKPLLLLADGVRQVAGGDLSPKLISSGNNELDGLTRSFAGMTKQLFEARKMIEENLAAINFSKKHLETILDNITAGVIVLSKDFVIESTSAGAIKLLMLDASDVTGKKITDIHGLYEFGQDVQQKFNHMQPGKFVNGPQTWQDTFEIKRISSEPRIDRNEDVLVVIGRGARLPGELWLLVFDDISEIITAQRSKAWGEVAKRLAHEIKNPLTPIQLAAERIEQKLFGKLEKIDQLMLTKSVKIIVNQVEAMILMVNEFRNFGRLPIASLKPVDLNLLVTEVLQLYDNSSSEILVTSDLEENCPLVLGDSLLLRQVIHNLIQNSEDATESKGVLDKTQKIVVSTMWLAESNKVRIRVSDSGVGFSADVLNKVFEPYVTTKEKGTGLGMAIVHKIAEEHGSRVDVSNRYFDNRIVGAQVSILLNVEKSAS